jgi:crotonobetainyl-CoA:carnitine CoA-transferase CaiB-like acyl-CoA transferase
MSAASTPVDGAGSSSALRERMPQALTDVRVLDFSHVIAGPFATFHLAQLGAQVTKVERPGAGDVMRRTPAGLRAFTALNAGKRAWACDFDSPEGQAQILECVRETDVLVDNYRPGVLERRGLGYDVVRALNPRIIYCAISGYGHTDAEHRTRGAYDHVVQALTGMTMLAGHAGEPPQKVGFPVVDAATGIIGALAIVSALRERDLTGQGCFLDVSMWASALQLMYTFTCETMVTGEDPPRVGNKGFSGSPAADTFACSEGWLSIGANTPAQVARLLKVLEVPGNPREHLLEPADDDGPRFAQARDPQAFRALLAECLSQRSAADWEQWLNDAGVPAARVRTLGEFTQEAVASGALTPRAFGVGDESTVTPGLGWRVLG